MTVSRILRLVAYGVVGWNINTLSVSKFVAILIAVVVIDVTSHIMAVKD
jgi:hypothetical protein